MMDLTALSDKRILVIGDVMLDRYLWGDVSRISPEAPVPVVHVLQRSEVPGGAGNVASNLAGLQCPVSILGVRGNDDAGNRLEDILRQKGIEPLFQVSRSRPTITKTRIMAKGQQLLRLDEEQPRTLSQELESGIIAGFEQHISRCDGVVLSDYGKGLLQTPGICQHIINGCNRRRIPVLVDPKGTDWRRYQNATCITPNTAEFALVFGADVSKDDMALRRAADEIRGSFGLECLLVTRGAQGMHLCGGADATLDIPARAREVFDVSGAGDTVIATLAAGLAIGLSFAQAARLANMAAGIVVGKLGTQPITRPELATALQLDDIQHEDAATFKIAPLESARILVKSWQSSGQKVVFTNGCYDLLHPGHIHLLHQSRNQGNRLVVGVNTDASVQRLKGPTRPILAERDRAAILGALACVDLVVLFDEDTPLELIRQLKPDVLVKGADYRLDQVVGKDIVESYGGKVFLAPLLSGYSTTGIISRAKS